MKNLVFFLFVFVVCLWVSKGQKSTEGPLVPLSNEEPSVNEEDSDNQDVSVSGAPSPHSGTVDSGNSTSEDEGLAAWITKRTCQLRCSKTESYKKSRLAWCGWKRCTKYSTEYRKTFSTCTRCCKGWTGQPGICRDVNECRSKPCAWNAKCINTPGSYQCICDRGYTMGRRECVDINECKWWNPCSESGTCHNVPGSYNCVCRRGYRWNGKTCVDINECASIRLMHYRKCVNTPGSYYITCIEGFQEINKTCIDINECLKNPCPAATCLNYPGSYRCLCKPGYRLVNGRCIDINECEYTRCEHTCVNTPGSFFCRCRKGFELVKNQYCIDINECRCNNGGCHFPYRCINTPGSYYCGCPYGFEARGNMCHRLVPKNKLKYNLPGNPTAIPKMKPHTSTLTPSES